MIPHDYEHLPGHLQQVHDAAQRLLARVHQQLGREIQPATLEEHYGDDAFEGMLGVAELLREPDHFSIATGRSTHFLLEKPTVPDCPHHEFGRSVELHCQAGDLPIINRSIEAPRAYFTNTRLHHCSHADVDEAKHTIINDENELRCGLRSGRKGDAFCEIARFEDVLCCRTCCFQQVCTSSEILRLPCVLPK